MWSPRGVVHLGDAQIPMRYWVRFLGLVLVALVALVLLGAVQNNIQVTSLNDECRAEQLRGQELHEEQVRTLENHIRSLREQVADLQKERDRLVSSNDTLRNSLERTASDRDFLNRSNIRLQQELENVRSEDDLFREAAVYVGLAMDGEPTTDSLRALASLVSASREDNPMKRREMLDHALQTAWADLRQKADSLPQPGHDGRG